MKPVPHWNLFAQEIEKLDPLRGRRFIMSVDYRE
jgi:hypothetical protein